MIPFALIPTNSLPQPSIIGHRFRNERKAKDKHILPTCPAHSFGPTAVVNPWTLGVSSATSDDINFVTFQHFIFSPIDSCIVLRRRRDNDDRSRNSARENCPTLDSRLRGFSQVVAPLRYSSCSSPHSTRSRYTYTALTVSERNRLRRAAAKRRS